MTMQAIIEIPTVGSPTGDPDSAIALALVSGDPSVFDLATLAAPSGLALIGFDVTGSYDPTTQAAAYWLAQAANAIQTLSGAIGQLSVDPGTDPNTAVVSIANPCTFPGPAIIPGNVIGGVPGAGKVGEIIELVLNTTDVGAVVLASGTVANILSINLTAGNWRVTGMAAFHGDETADVFFNAGSSGVSAALPSFEFFAQQRAAGTSPGTSDTKFVIPQRIVRTAIPITIYLVGEGNFSGGTSVVAGGKLTGERLP